jgi:hypothetical protein
MGIFGRDNPFQGIGNIGQLKQKFGLPQWDESTYRRMVGDIFAPAKRSLNTGLARSRSAQASRLGNRAATPEYAFAPLEAGYADAMSNLEGQKAGSILSGFERSQDRDFNLSDLMSQIFQQNANQPNWLDDILSVAGTGANIYSAFGRRK